ncbi:metal-dependent hydrolase [Nitrosomonas sp.]|uniref:metal-dependent hydrolase n=1 Tax=Nitrosomonas sp. TaxID=42353 RepID=UPI002730BE1A|nr:metal-dependent hydrolase [Nitrosomonas sp.]MDP1786126.1 metal-dependent hydrolase [Nitrosomonas sp.]MDP2225307.1 metal-dependent hydrolase [Nitrosomonas sp.]
MDPITHALSGALLARAAAAPPSSQRHPEQTDLPLRLQVTAGFIAAAFPDVDLVLRLIDTLTYLNWHQGPTHSLILLPLWAWLLAWLFSGFSRGRYAWKLFYRSACLGLAIHIAGDLITSYGLMLFAPFSIERFSLPLAFVIDPWFSLIIIAGLVVSWRYPQRRIPSIAALAGLCGYGIFLWTLHQQAVKIAIRHANAYAMPHAQINVLPQPLSPFHWKIIIRHDENYQLALVNLGQTTNQQQDPTAWLLSRMAAAYRPVAENDWQIHPQFGDDPTTMALVREAWLHPVLEPFRAFAAFPVLERIEISEQGLCVWFYDLRFKFPELPPSFRYGVCRQDSYPDWEMFRQRGLFYID